jgi:hypothetical protein
MIVDHRLMRKRMMRRAVLSWTVALGLALAAATPIIVSEPSHLSPNGSMKIVESQLASDKLNAEIAKLEEERKNLSLQNQALGVAARRWSAFFGAIGGFTGAILTFLVGYAGLKLKASQDARLEQDKAISQKRLDQDKALARESKTLEVLRDLGHANPRTQIAAASLLLQRLSSYRRKGELDELEQLERPTIIKVLVSVLKEKGPGSDSFDTLRKYIADNLVRVIDGEMHEYDWQNTNLSKVWWKGVDARGVDFYQANLEKSGLREAHLEGAVFYEADLKGAVLRDAHVEGTNFFGARLDGVDLRGAKYDEKTTWPEDFRPEGHGAVRAS